MLTALIRHRNALSLTAAAASWGIATVISKGTLEQIPPLTLLPVQLAVSVALLTSMLWARRQSMEWSPAIRRLGALGLLNPGVAYALSLVGLAQITASLAVLLWAIEPILIVMLGWWILGEQIHRSIAAATFVAFLGVILIVFQPGNEGRLLGIVLTLAGVAACAFYTVWSSKLITTESTLHVLALQQACALVFALVLLVAVTLMGWSTAPVEIPAEAWVSAVISGLLYYAIAFWFYLNGLRGARAAVAGLFINLIPVFGIAAGQILLGERFTSIQWLGALLIVATVGMTVAGRPTVTTGERGLPR